MKDFKNGVTKIFLILGDACNMNCKYCKAHLAASKTEVINNHISPKALAFLEKTIKETPTLVNFYGGEPLLYFDTIKQIIDTLQIPDKDVIWSTMTNGRSITPEMVEYFNDKKVTVNFSWDGAKTSFLRGFDVFADEQLRKNILNINDLWINSTLTSLNYPLEILESHKRPLMEYQKIHGHPYGVHIGLATPAKANDPLYIYDYERIYREMSDVLYQFVFCGGISHNPLEMTAADCIARTLLFTLQKKARKVSDVCLDMDINGNFFMCPFSRKTVDTVDTFADYMEKALVLKEARKCKENCPIASFCDGGCPQLKGTPLFEEGCKLRKAFYTPILDLITGRLAEMKGVVSK